MKKSKKSNEAEIEEEAAMRSLGAPKRFQEFREAMKKRKPKIDDKGRVMRLDPSSNNKITWLRDPSKVRKGEPEVEINQMVIESLDELGVNFQQTMDEDLIIWMPVEKFRKAFIEERIQDSSCKCQTTGSIQDD